MIDEIAPLDIQHTAALFELLGHTGVTNVEVGWINDDEPYLWWAKANWRGRRIYSDNHGGSDLAVWAMARKALHGGKCVRCDRTMTFPHLKAGRCSRILIQASEGDVMVYRPLCDTTMEVPGDAG